MLKKNRGQDQPKPKRGRKVDSTKPQPGKNWATAERLSIGEQAGTSGASGQRVSAPTSDEDDCCG